MPFFALLGCVADLVIFTIACGALGLIAVTFGPTLTPIMGPVLTIMGPVLTIMGPVLTIMGPVLTLLHI